MFCNLLSMISASKEIGRRLEICSKNSSLDPRFTSLWFRTKLVSRLWSSDLFFQKCCTVVELCMIFFPAPLLFHMLDTFCLLISCHSILKYRINEDIKYILIHAPVLYYHMKGCMGLWPFLEHTHLPEMKSSI